MPLLLDSLVAWRWVLGISVGMSSVSSTIAAPAPLSDAALADLGKEIPLSQVHRELATFFASDQPVTRASLMNFAIYSESATSLDTNTDLIREITREHACRALLIHLQPTDATPSVRTWVTAHCNLGSAGKKSVCSEQISFLLKGDRPGLLSNTLFAHLDSDLPLVFWWQGNFTQRWEPTLYSRIDRLVVDSSEWTDPVGQCEVLENAWREPTSRFNVMDLSWTRILQLRLALAACFDDASSLGALASLQSMTVSYDPAQPLPAKMLVVWIAKRMGLRLESVSADKSCCTYTSAEGLKITANFIPTQGPRAIEQLELKAPAAQWTIEHCPESNCWRSTATLGGAAHHYLTPATLVSSAQMAIERLRRGCNNKLYFSILQEIRQLL